MRIKMAGVLCALAAASVVVWPSLALAQTVLWTQPLPSPRSGSAMVYDSIRNVTVLFGGYNGIPLGDTWEWDGTNWTQRAGSGPTARYGHAMAYDSGRGVTMLFGGYNRSSFFGDTWEWNGTAWTQRASSGPLASYYRAMAYDSARGVTVLFGGAYSNGSGYSFFGDTWEWNGTAWAQRASAGPAARYAHTTAYDSTRGVTVLFGGYNGSSVFGDTWEWNGTAWTQRADSGPPAREFHAMAYDGARGVTVLFGGYYYNGGDHYLGDTWEWDGSAWTQRANTGPSARSYHVMAYDSRRGLTVLFGGTDADNNYLGDTWEWSPGAPGWTQRASSGPRGRHEHAMTYDSARGLTVLFGGIDANNNYLGDTWEWDGAVWTQRANSGPPTRYEHAMAYNSADAVTVLFGGVNRYGGNYSHFRDTWEWNGAAWTLRTNAGPSARNSHAMAYDNARRVTVLFGGRDSSLNALGDTWEWNGSVWTQRAGSGPSARYWHAMAYDSARRVTVLFGGFGYNGTGNGYLGDIWEWNGAAWTPRPGLGPSLREGPAMAHDSARGVTVLFGGFGVNGSSSSFFGDTWEWNGAAWTQRASPGPWARVGHGMAFDSVRGVTVLFGGSNGGFLGDTWEYVSSPVLTQQPIAQAVCQGGSVTIAAAVSGSAPLNYRWRRSTTQLTDRDPHISGAATATLTINPATLADAATDYNVVVNNVAGAVTSGNVALSVYATGTGDANGDGVVDGQDVGPFVAYLLNGGAVSAGFCASDMNGDGARDGDDVQAFVNVVMRP